MAEQDLETKQLNFLIGDYQSKSQYLKDHFTRIWNRFNYFLTLQSALFGAAVLSPEKYHWWVPVFGAILSILWYVFGAQDRYLVDLYRKQVEHTWLEIRKRLQLSDDYYVGQTEDIEDQNERIEALGVDNKIYQWRVRNLSTTKLTAIFPLVIFAMWVLAFFLLR